MQADFPLQITRVPKYFKKPKKTNRCNEKN